MISMTDNIASGTINVSYFKLSQNKVNENTTMVL